MSDSEPVHVPSDEAIARKLEQTVISFHKSGNAEDITVKRVRARAEKELGLPADFLKESEKWKKRSSNVIKEAEKHCGDEPPETPKAPQSSKPAPARKKIKDTTAASGRKRTAHPPKKPPKPQKRRKTVVLSDEESDVASSEPPSEREVPSDTESGPPIKPDRRGNRVVKDDPDLDHSLNGLTASINLKPEVQDEEGDEDALHLPPVKGAATNSIVDVKDDVSGSELSSLIDESPVKKKRQKKLPSEKRQKVPKSAKTTATNAKPSKLKSTHYDEPDQAEIKRLQGWLVKCGIRKVWSKELSRYDTAKEKIRHLKEMLKDAGMDGKYSNEKAARIKEQREFAAELEAIQEGEKHWGTEANSGGRPRRRAAANAPRKVVVEEPSEESDREQGQGQDHNDDDDGIDDNHDGDEQDQGDGDDKDNDDLE
ncbi:hypothetical protein CC78DRAFT_613262 [Lojkania enalia]|uniref:Transcriptional regulator n=1 Tax=Lojkania enalia TaxID=147567 RepID=A0A9P4N6L5_9PLEO|nr:hypothetical protein CC78DRAFT_613262 [Didymosphaeria enalia]